MAGNIMSSLEQDHQCSHPTWLPPGFRFHPTDEELITYYLARKVAADGSFTDHGIITHVDLNSHEPWDLPGMAQTSGEKEWYFFSQKDRKYPSGCRSNRATRAGYWKATGKDKEVFMKSSSGCNGRKQLVGMKKTLVFYEGRAPRGLKSNWVMHEYRIDEHAKIASMLDNNVSLTQFQGRKEEWVLCRVFHKKLRHSKREYVKSNDAIDKDAELLARFLLADDVQQLGQSPLNRAAPPLYLAAADELAAEGAKWACSSSQSRVDSASISELPALRPDSMKNDCCSSEWSCSGGFLPLQSRACFDAARTFFATSPLPRFPSELESFWLHASAFLG